MLQRLSGFVTLIVLCLASSTVSAAPFAYIANYWGNTVSVIDTATNDVVATVPVEAGPFGVAVNPAGTRVYVTSELGLGNTVSVIDTSSNTVTATVTVGTLPFSVAVNPAGTRVYVTNRGSHNVSVIDTSSNTVTATVAVGWTPEGVAVNPAGTRVYVANAYSHTVSVIDTATNAVVATVAVGNYPIGVAVNPAGTRVYVANSNVFTNNSSGSVSVIDTETNAVVATVEVGVAPEGIAVNPAGTRVYVANYTSNNVSVIDTAINAVVATVAVGVGTIPYGVAVNPAGTRLYVANAGSDNVSVIDTTTNNVIGAPIPVGNTPFSFGMFIGPDTPDTTAPTTVASVSPAANEAGWNNVNVTVTLTATDNTGGSGVQSISYTLSGAQIGAANVTGSAASALITAEGTTTVTYHACDVAGNVESDKTVVINLDKTVLSPAQAMTNLLAQVMSLGFQQGSSLLKNALSQLGRGNTTAACNQMGAFINQVRAQAGKQLTTAQAAELIQVATDIRGSLACS